MKKVLIVDVFEVTETCQNGNERRVKKEVYSPCTTDTGEINGLDTRIAKAAEELREEHFYNIKFVRTSFKTIIWAEA